MRICIIGGGNIGTLLAAEFANKGHRVVLYVSQPGKWGTELSVYAPDDSLLFATDSFSVTDCLESAVTSAEQIWITYPSFMFPKLSRQLLPLVKPGQVLFIIPGSGGAEFFFDEHIKKGCTLCGLQRVHSIARVREYGKSVYMLGRKDQVHLASIPRHQAVQYAQTVSQMLEMPCHTLDNYLVATLTPSNPILHTSRLHSMFSDYLEGHVYERNSLFYEEWNNSSSELLLACDAELQALCCAMKPLNMDGVCSLKIHYQSDTADEMTTKIRSIPAFKGLLSPMKHTGQGWVPDFTSRYFTADFSYGLKIVLDIGHLFGIPMPNIEKIWNWYVNVGRPNSYFQLLEGSKEALISKYI